MDKLKPSSVVALLWGINEFLYTVILSIGSVSLYIVGVIIKRHKYLCNKVYFPKGGINAPANMASAQKCSDFGIFLIINLFESLVM